VNTTPPETGPYQVLDLDIRRVQARLDDTDEGLVIVLTDGDVEVHMAVRRNDDAWLHNRAAARALEQLEPEIRRRTIGWLHGPHTGPCHL
jgi:hypothetical protein